MFTYPVGFFRSSNSIRPTQLGANGNASSSTCVITTGANSPAGATIIVWFSRASTTTASSVTDSAGNSYTILDDISVAGIGGLGVAYAKNALALANGGTITVTYGAATVNGASAMSVTGLLNSGPADARNNTNNGASGTSSTAVTTGALVNPVEFVTGCIEAPTATGGFTPGGSFIAIGGTTTGRPIFPAYLIVGNKTSVSWSGSWTTNSAWITDVVSFKGG